MSDTIDLSARVAAANAGEYAFTPFTEGITAADFKAIVYAGHGERVRWWKAVGGGAAGSKNGMTYIEQPLGDDVRVLFFGDGLGVDAPQFGKIRIGDGRHSGMPDEIELGLNDRTLYPDRTRIASTTLKPSGSATDDLPRLHIAGIDLVLGANGEELDALQYELFGRAIRWRETPPTETVTIRYRYNPQYEFRGENDGLSFIGTDGGRLPQIVPVHLVASRDECE